MAKRINICHAVMNEHGGIFNEMIELLSDCLRSIGVRVTCKVNQYDPDRLNIFIGQTTFLPADFFAKIKGLEKGYIAVQLEVLDNEQGHAPDYPAYMEFLHAARQVWDYSPSNESYLVRRGLTNVRYIPIGYSRVLDRISDVSADNIDILFYGSPSPRRKKILDELSSNGHKVMWLFGKYGAGRDAYIARAKLVLNIHCFEALHLEQVRLSYLLNNKRFVVSEFPDMNPYGDGVVFCNYSDITEVCARFLKPEMKSERQRIAEIGYASLKNIPMASSIASALSDLALD